MDGNRTSTRYEFEPELHYPIPRPMPAWIGESEYLTRQSRAMFSLASIGVLCIGFAQAAWIQRLGIYLTPFARLDLIGGGFLLLAAGSLIGRLLRRGPLAYLVKGTPLVAEVISVAKVPTVRVNGVDARYAIAAEVEFLHPVTGQQTRQITQSADFLADNRDRYTTSLRVGDRVTALFLPSGVERSLKLYGFLGLNPARKFLIDAKHANTTRHLVQLVAQVVLLTIFFALLMANVYAIMFFRPLDFDWLKVSPPFLAGGCAVVLIVAALSYRNNRRAKAAWLQKQRLLASGGEAYELSFDSLWERKGLEGTALRALLLLGGPLLAGATALCMAFTLNALLDLSAPTPREIEIVRLVEEVHNGIIREYTVEFLSPFTQAKEEFSTDPSGLAALIAPSGELHAAEADIRDGYFGWRWVSDIRPKTGA